MKARLKELSIMMTDRINMILGRVNECKNGINWSMVEERWSLVDVVVIVDAY